MNDLLGQVKTGPPPPPQNFGGAAGAPQPPPQESPDKTQPEFFKQVEQIQAQLVSIRQNLAKLLESHERSKVVTRGADMKSLREKMQGDINQVQRTAHQIKRQLEALEKHNDTARKQKGCEVGTASERTRTSITVSLAKKLRDLMAEFQQLRQKLQDEYREVVERRVYTVTGQRPDEEQVDQLIETGESETIFQKAILEQGRGQVEDTVAEIQERHEAVKDLEKSLLDLHQIFLDMAVLVEAQGEMLDNIEAQVSRSVEYVAAGTTALVDAKTIQKKTRKLQCCLLLTVLIIAVIIGIVVWQVTK